LWIVPAYGSAGLRIDTARVTGPKRLGRRAVIEFGDVRIDAAVRSISPAPRQSSSARLRSDPVHSRRARPSPSRTFEERELGVSEVARSVPPRCDGPLPTVAFDRFVRSSVAQSEQVTVRFSAASEFAVIPVERTVIVEPISVTPLESESESVPSTLKTGSQPPKSVTANQAFAVVAPSRIRAVGEVDEITLRSLPATAPEWLNTSDGASVAADKRPSARAERVEVLTSGSETVSQETSYFEPMRISRASFGADERVVAQSITTSDVPRRPSKQETRVVHWVAELGRLSKRKPLLVWLGSAVTAFLLAAMVSRFSRHTADSARANTKQTDRVTRTVPAVPASATASPASTPNRAAAPLVLIPATPATVSTKAKKGRSQNPELVSAVESLVSGHQSDAQAAYSKLAAAAPDDQALRTVSELLVKKLSSRCAGAPTRSNVSCPEVKP
jgi:hypothetical protein